MAVLITPFCEYGKSAVNFNLEGVDGRFWSSNKARGSTGLLVMFLSNQSPFVDGILDQLVIDVAHLKSMGVGVVAINANDADTNPEESLANMAAVSQKHNFNFPYLSDKDQNIARAFGAVCTPDFFGFNASMELQYRGRLDSSGQQGNSKELSRELVDAMRQVAFCGIGPTQQIPSVGCSIKWREEALSY